VIQSALYFAFGFLSAVLLALLVAPPIWRRAMLLTRRHVEAETPLTLNEIQAQRDGLRAEHAIAERKLELTLESSREKSALQLAELGEKERLMRNLTSELAARDATIAELRSSSTDREQELEKAAAIVVGHERLIEQKSAELELLHRRASNVAMNADSFQIEVAAQSARIDNLSDDLKEARQDKRDSDNLRQRAEADIKAVQHSLVQETKRSAELEKRSNALLRQISDSEAKLSRREKEIERINERLRKVLAEGRKQGSSVLDTPRGKQALVQAQETERLRDEMNTLAAQVVAMVARLEGPTSKVDELLAKAESEMSPVHDENGEIIVSLADRIRALQTAASETRKAAETR
jgi:chromosome segregation ATPase